MTACKALKAQVERHLAFGAKVTGHTFGTSAIQPPRLNLLRLEKDLSAVHLRLARVTIEHLPWQDCITRYDRPDTLRSAVLADHRLWRRLWAGRVPTARGYQR